MLALRTWTSFRRGFPGFRHAFASNASASSHNVEGFHQQVSVVHDVRTASRAIEALLTLPEGTPVAWSSQALPPHPSPALITLCAYAGDLHQNGLWTFISPSPKHEAEVWALMRGYFADRATKAICFDVDNWTSNLRNRGIHANGCVHDVKAMARMSGLKEKGFDASVRTLLTKRTLAEREAMFKGQDRPWEALSGELRPSSEEWLLPACADAHAILHIYQRLRKKMLKKGTISAEASNTFDAYEKFYALVDKELCAIGQYGLPLSEDMLSDVLMRFEYESNSEQSIFDKWAQNYCGEVANVHLTSPMLRHLLFAPYQNIHNASEKTPTEKTFSGRRRVPRGQEGFSTGKSRSAQKRNVLIRGAGLEAQKHTSNGVPSVSISALQALTATLDSTEEADLHAAFSAINGLLNSQTARLAAQRLKDSVAHIVDYEGMIRPRTTIDFERGRLHCNIPSDVLEVLGAKRDHELLVLDFKNLSLCVLADLSGCTGLKKRLQFKDGVHAYLAKEFSNEISNALYDGSCVLEGEGVTVEKAFPEKFQMAKMLDTCMSKGARTEVVKSVLKCDHARALQLIDGWFQIHPAVKSWYEQQEGRMRDRKVAETVCGRQRVLKVGKGKRSAFAVSEGMTFVIEGSAGDFMMQSLLRMVQSERINALAWKAVLAYGDKIILHGPSWSAEEAIPAILDSLATSKGGGPIIECALHQLRVLRGENLRALQRQQ
eukprot:TRINITY_DN18967_c0_g1_i1.p1 TRINITY_DN18967_c0_g1~~TRINITY_DN18967_c0_g1_i1.p1  ORF type:complete len:718 (-),score=99.56 TRINITY_DN18967_c0_g1_i1:154-2307(-)